VGARTDTARSEVVASREALVDEVERLGAAGRAAIDIPARARRNPGKTAALAAGSLFLIGGGPGRVLRGLRTAVFGSSPLPKSMLPAEIDRALRELGDDGDRVRGTLEREFAAYLDQSRPRREERDVQGALAGAFTNVIRPTSRTLGIRLAKQLAQYDEEDFRRALGSVRRALADAGIERPTPGPGPTAAAAEAGGTGGPTATTDPSA
jgi:hypothetical protein